ncbi:MAG: substrate-binding domain-containing protein [Saprospiraceae bacterium]|nr:substrate-binding domain-containing protein [Saprospiraceae bacterium]HRG67908.1 substrate-binding domain-containing protein [Saprospiraceae bacterium]
MINRLMYLLICCLFLTACKQQGYRISQPTIGSERLLCDQNLKYIISQEEEIFELNYKYAHLDINYFNETEIFKKLGTDSMSTAISCRPLSESETKYFVKNQVNPRLFPFAVGAIALLTNKNVKDSGILYESFAAICKGIPVKNSSFHSIVIEDIGSGIASYLLQKFNLDSFGKQVYTLKDKETLFNYVSQDPGIIAVVDWSEFCDSDDRMQQQRLKGLKRLAISRPMDSLQMGYLLPDQYLFQDQKYPLTRTLYFISVSGKSDLGIGFASFVTGEIGQKILLKAGLLPLYQTDRWIELKSSPFRVIE